MGSCAHNHAKATLSKPINRVRKGAVVTDTTKSVVLDREVEEEKPGESETPRIRCPLCGWSPRKEDRWFCECGHGWNTFCISGLRRSASRAAVGRCIRTGMPSSSG